jgi:uncharacterized membrane-anchored protein
LSDTTFAGDDQARSSCADYEAALTFLTGALTTMDATKYGILLFLAVCVVGGIITLCVYARQHWTQLEKDATLIKYIGVLIWCGGLIWLCLTNDILETTIAVPLIVSGVVLHLNGLKYEILRGLKNAQVTGPDD